jgi:hypothetical protein
LEPSCPFQREKASRIPTFPLIILTLSLAVAAVCRLQPKA